MKNAVGKWSQHQYHLGLPLSAKCLTLPMKWLETWNYELASPTGPLGSLSHCVFMSKK